MCRASSWIVDSVTSRAGRRDWTLVDQLEVSDLPLCQFWLFFCCPALAGPIGLHLTALVYY